MSAKIVLKINQLKQENPPKNIAASNISENSVLLIFLPYVKNKYFLGTSQWSLL